MSAVRYPFNQKPRRPGRFTTKAEGFARAIPVNWCLQCNRHAGEDRGAKGMHCSNCGSKAQHFASTGEFKHYAHRRMLRDAGEITDLYVQVRFPIYFAVANGQPVLAKQGFKLWRTYIADLAYREKGLWVIEEFKGNKKFQDEASKVRREAAVHVYQLNLRIVEA